MKGEKALVWVSAVVVLVRSLLLPICVFYMSMGVASRTRVLSWPSEVTVDGRIDGREPHVLVGQNNRYVLSLTGCQVLPAQAFTGVSPTYDHLIPLVQGGNGGQGAFSPSVQASVNVCHRVVTWLSSSLPESCFKFSKQGQNVSKGDRGLAARARGCGCFGRKGNQRRAF